MTTPEYGSVEGPLKPSSTSLIRGTDQLDSLPAPYFEHLLIDIPMGGQQKRSLQEKADDQNNLLWTKNEVAKQLNVSTRTVPRLIQGGKLPRIQFGRNVRIEIQAVHHFLNEQREYNGECVESAVRNPTGERACRIGTRKDVKMAVSTQVRTTRSASPQMEKDFNALLGLEP